MSSSSLPRHREQIEQCFHLIRFDGAPRRYYVVFQSQICDQVQGRTFRPALEEKYRTSKSSAAVWPSLRSSGFTGKWNDDQIWLLCDVSLCLRGFFCTPRPRFYDRRPRGSQGVLYGDPLDRAPIYSQSISTLYLTELRRNFRSSHRVEVSRMSLLAIYSNRWCPSKVIRCRESPLLVFFRVVYRILSNEFENNASQVR